MSSGGDRYKKFLNQAAYAYWRGPDFADFGDFADSMFTIIRTGLTAAWAEGAKRYGIKLDELSPEERMELQKAIISEESFINQLANFIEQNSQANGGKLYTIRQRMDQWARRYYSIVEKARANG